MNLEVHNRGQRKERQPAVALLQPEREKSSAMHFSVERDVAPYLPQIREHFETVEKQLVEVQGYAARESGTQGQTAHYLSCRRDFALLFPEQTRTLPLHDTLKQHLGWYIGMLGDPGTTPDNTQKYYSLLASSVVQDPAIRQQFIPTQEAYKKHVELFERTMKELSGLFVGGFTTSFLSLFPEYRHTEGYQRYLVPAIESMTEAMSGYIEAEMWGYAIKATAAIRFISPETNVPVSPAIWLGTQDEMREAREEQRWPGWNDFLNLASDCALVAAEKVTIEQNGVHLVFDTQAPSPALPVRSVV